MDANNRPTRRRFLSTAGAALSAPLAAAGAYAATGPEAVGVSPDEHRTRLEDVNAIRALYRDYARRVNHGASDAAIDANVQRLSADSFGEDDAIALARDGQTATGVFHCVVHSRTPIEPGCTLVDMARAQGEGYIERSQPSVIEADFIKEDGAWKIRSVTRRPA